MKIITGKIKISELKDMSARFGNMVKAVVDIGKEHIAVDAELHSDLEALCLEQGAQQKNLWGINFYPDLEGDDFVEFDSMINIRPSQKNMSRGVDSPETQMKIREIVAKRVEKS
ncbi:MAG: hypothetical protein A2Z83_07920 [Omnitrophica bacterium GWA2_52_8]|nr:MAG: hypothetical protein A2Z83_07920 [Omnitrophica bacterium GWA2_52_8]